MATSDLTLEIIPDPGVYGDWLNRYCQNAETKEILYYCDVSSDSNFEIHRGKKSGPVIATSSACLTTPGATDIQTTDPHPYLPVNLEHIHHDEYLSRTKFTTEGHEYHWNGHEELVDEKGNVLASLSWVTRAKEKTGKLVIKPEGQHEPHLMDLIVLTALVVQERSDEARSWF